MRVLVTGGGGFIGAWIIRRLAEAGHDPVVFDMHQNRGKVAEIAGRDLADRIDWHVGDIVRTDPVIAAALADRPLSADEAGIGQVRCEVRPASGGIELQARIPMARPGPGVETVVETADPQVWASQPDAVWTGGQLLVSSRLKHAGGGAFALDRKGLRFTVISQGRAVDIRGCTG